MNYSFKHNENAAGAAPGILDRVFSFFVRRKSETLYQRFLRYLEEAHRDGVMGGGRYAVALGKAHKLQRFLTIIGQPSISAHKFTTDMVLRFRHFIYDEYKYASQYPALYPCGAGHRSHQHWGQHRPPGLQALPRGMPVHHLGAVLHRREPREDERGLRQISHEARGERRHALHHGGSRTEDPDDPQRSAQAHYQ